MFRASRVRVVLASASDYASPFSDSDSDLAAVILFSISVLVPINNRIASLNAAAPAAGWELDHRKWDVLHRVRILLLIVVLFVVINSLVA
jgi:hypothetical protein